MEKLYKELTKLEHNTIVYLGTNKGDSWLMIAPVDELIVQLDHLDDIYLRKTIHSVEYAETLLRRAINRIDKIKKEIKDAELYSKSFLDTEYSEERIKEMSKSLKMNEKLRDDLEERIRDKKEFLANRTNLAQREVVTKYLHRTDTGICYIIEGMECGKYWYIEEVCKEELNAKYGLKEEK